MEETIFAKAIGNTPRVKVLEFLIEGRELDYSLSDIAEGSGIGRTTLFRIWVDFENLKFVKQTRTIGNAKLFKLNLENEFIKKLVELFDVLIINSYEFSDLIKRPYKKIDFKKLEIKLPYLKDRILIITDAEKGSYGYFNDQIYYQDIVKPKKIVDTTGCGDAYTAGFIAQYIKSLNIESSMYTGAKYAAEKLSRIGAN